MPDQQTIALTSAIIAGISASVGILTVILNVRSARKSSISSTRASQAADRSNQIAMGQSENGLRATITGCRDRYEDVCSQLEQVVKGRLPTNLSADEKRLVTAIDARRKSSLENLVNAYETACSQYIDDKVDTERFKKSYIVEIRVLVESPEESIQRLFVPEGTSRYKAIWKVYRGWNDLEN